MKYIYLFLCLFVTSFVWGQAAGDFRSNVASGNWNVAGSWQTFNGTTWVAAGAAPTSADGVITILTGHSILITANVTTDQTVIQTGGTLTVNSGGVTLTLNNDTGSDEITVNAGGALTNNGIINFGTISIRTINVSGDLNNSGTFTNQGNSKLLFQSGANYFHVFADAGVVPRATWNINSTLNVIGYTSGSATPPTFAPGQTFGNFVWNSPNQDTNIDLAGNPASVDGNFQIDDTGSAALIFNSTPAANNDLSIGGDLISNGGAFAYIFGTGAPGTLSLANTTSDIIIGSSGYIQFADDDNLTITCLGNFSIASGGTVDFSANTAVTDLDLSGDFTDAGGVYINGAAANINFVGSSLQTFTSSTTPGGALNYNVGSGSIVSITASSFFGGSSGTVLLQSGGELRVNSVHGSGAIQNGNAAGSNIRVPTVNRTYQSGSKIVYANLSTAQFMGNGQPATAGVNTEINSLGVTLFANATIGGDLTLTSGNLSLSNRTLTLNGNFTPNSNFLNLSALSSLTIGGSGPFGTLATTGSTTITNLTLNRTGLNLSLGNDLTLSSVFTQTNGDLSLNGHAFQINGNYLPALPGGSIIGTSGSSFVVAGSGSLPTVSFSGTFTTFTLNRSGTTLTTPSSFTVTNLNLLAGILSNTTSLSMAAGGTITRQSSGSMTATPTISGSYNVIYNITSGITAGPELPSSTTSINDVTINSGATLTLAGDLTVNGVLSISNGGLNTLSNNVTLKGNFIFNGSGTFTSSTFTFGGSTTMSGTQTPVFGAITVASLSTLTPTANFQINGNVLNNGTLNLGPGTTTFGGTTTISGSSVSAFNDIIISGTLTAPSGASFLISQGTFRDDGFFNNNGSTILFIGNSFIAGSAVPNFASITVVGTFTSPASLNVSQDFTNNGTFVEGTGTLLLNGTSIQNIQGSSITNFNNITVTNAAAPVHVESSQNLIGVLTLSGGATFDADGNANTSVFTLISSNDGAVFNNTKTSDASIATLPAGASVTGSVTVQRYMSIEGPNNTRIYRYISSAVQNAPVSQIQLTIPVTGSFTGSSTCTGCGTAQSMFLYDEPTPGTLDVGYTDFPVNSNTEVLATARGYSMFERGNVISSGLWSVMGVVNSGTINFPVSFTAQNGVANDGWNLVGNPFPSTIDWNAASGWTKSADITSTIYMTDNAAGTPPNYVTLVATWNGVTGTNGGSRYISIGQGFYVKSDGTATPSLIANENVKSASTQSIFFREVNPGNLLRVALNQNGTRDEAVIHFRSDATEGFDGQADAYKLKNSTFNLSSFSQDSKLAINSLPLLQCTRIVKLDVSDVTPGAYHFDFSNVQSFDPAVHILAHDAFAGNNNWIDLTSQSGYDFQVTTDSASFGSGRFVISFGYDNQLPTALEVNADAVCGATDSKITVSNSSTSLNYFAKVNGETVTPVTTGNGQALSLTIDKTNLKLGDNAVTIVSQSPNCLTLTYSQDVSVKVDGIYSAKSNGSMNCREGSVTLIASGAPAKGSYNWYDKVDATSPIAGQTGPQFITPSLAKTGTYFVSAVNSIGCEGERIPVVATIVNYDDAAITLVDDKTLKSNYATGNHWYLDGELLTDTTVSITIKSSGLYALEVSIGTCTTRDEKSLVVTGLGETATGIKGYPNPVSGIYILELPAEKSDMDDLPVFNTLGGQIGTVKLTKYGNMKKGQFDFTSHSAGFYYIRAVSGTNITVIKVIKN